MSAGLIFHDVHLSEVMEGVTGTARDGVFTYKVFVAAEALRELGASSDTQSWLLTFHGHRERIASCAKQIYLASPQAAVCVLTFAADRGG